MFTSHYPSGAGQSAGSPNYYRSSTNLTPNSAVALGAVGAVIGAVSATAASLELVKNQKMTSQAALLNVAKEAAGTGLATAAGGLAARTIGLGGFTGLLGMFTVATGVKYFWNQAMYKGGAVKTQAEEKPKTAKKAAKK